jgi:hypothetical protein
LLHNGQQNRHNHNDGGGGVNDGANDQQYNIAQKKDRNPGIHHRTYRGSNTHGELLVDNEPGQNVGSGNAKQDS